MVKTPKCSCPHAQSLFSLLGKKWIMFILQAVDHGATTFTDIRRDIGDANTKILTDRLAELVELGILSKSKELGSYGLTPKGKELADKLIALGEWWGKSK